MVLAQGLLISVIYGIYSQDGITAGLLSLWIIAACSYSTLRAAIYIFRNFKQDTLSLRRILTFHLQSYVVVVIIFVLYILLSNLL